MFKKAFSFLVVMLAAAVILSAQMPVALQDSLVIDTIPADTLKVDSLTPNILKVRDSLTNVKWLDSLNNGYGFAVFDLKSLLNQSDVDFKNVTYKQGDLLAKGQLWVLYVIAVLLVLFAVLKNAFGKQLGAIVQSFYSNSALINLNKEDNLVTSWSFLLLFIQFGFTVGMFFFLVAKFLELPQTNGGLVFFLTLSLAVIFLYLAKIVFLRFLGFVFGVQKVMHQYISILYLSYFNGALLIIPIAVAFALSPEKYGYVYVMLGLLAFALIFVSQFIRASFNILSQQRFPKVYLILYFCTLEICPILILIKAIGL